MPYVAPSNLTVPFSFTGEGYSPAAGSAIAFVFNPNITLTGAGGYSLSGIAGIRHGVALSGIGETGLSGLAVLDLQEVAELSVAARIGASGGANFYYGEPFSLIGSGALGLHGLSELFAVPMFVGRGGISEFSGHANLLVGNSYLVGGVFRLDGRASMNLGSTVSLSGQISKMGGGILLQHGCELHTNGSSQLSGEGWFHHPAVYGLVCDGRLKMEGVGYFYTPLPGRTDTTWVLLRQSKGSVQLC